jgi:hypothetical protein
MSLVPKLLLGMNREKTSGKYFVLFKTDPVKIVVVIKSVINAYIPSFSRNLHRGPSARSVNCLYDEDLGAFGVPG